MKVITEVEALEEGPDRLREMRGGREEEDLLRVQQGVIIVMMTEDEGLQVVEVITITQG